jgi:N-acetylglutamate synthase-like GNAT family acetyltransferase
LESEKTYTLQAAQAGDFPAIRTLIHEVGINPMGLDWRRFILAVDPKGTMIGCGQVKPHADGSLELASIAVRPDWRQRGIASAIIQYLLDTHPRPLFLTCRSELGSFYETFGFKEINADQMPAYFQRIFRLVGFMRRLKVIPHTLLVMKLEE